MNFLKLATVVATLTGFAQTTSAADLGPNLALNTDVKATYLWDAQTTVATINPEFSYTGLLKNLEMTAGTTLNIWENVGTKSYITDELKHLPVLEFGAKYAFNPKLGLETKVNYDLEAKKRNDISLIGTFSF